MTHNPNANPHHGTVELLDADFDLQDYSPAGEHVCSVCGAIEESDAVAVDLAAMDGWVCICCGHFHEAD